MHAATQARPDAAGGKLAACLRELLVEDGVVHGERRLKEKRWEENDEEKVWVHI